MTQRVLIGGYPVGGTIRFEFEKGGLSDQITRIELDQPLSEEKLQRLGPKAVQIARQLPDVGGLTGLVLFSAVGLVVTYDENRDRKEIIDHLLRIISEALGEELRPEAGMMF